jgi:hypothetical protein
MLARSCVSSRSTKARCTLVWFQCEASGRSLVILITRPVTGPRMSSTTLFTENDSVTTIESVTSDVRKNAIRKLS